ncbi:phosphoserine phosphatase SerB [Haematomicrobium sanguinis]|uniref:phosphoserine phosphatase SerB n=1 Tax=Haematomicrobium sanguinis TaxID=479106 RepID=UPI000AB49956|nr:phosphoserine phosphatase SerB [Haematomicrobium sanguinis]
MPIDVAAVLRDALPAGAAPHRLTVFGASVPDAALGLVQSAALAAGWQIRSSQFDSGAGYEANVWELRYDGGASPLSPGGTVEAGALRDALRDALRGESESVGALEFALVGGALATPGPKMLIMDVDSTLIRQEVIELLAARAGVEDRVRAVTEAAMRGELDFAQSLHERVATLAGLPASVIDDVVAEVQFTPGALELVQAFRSAGHPVTVVSGGFRQILEPLAARAHIDEHLANDLEIVDGHLTGRVLGAVVDSDTKARMLREWAAKYGVGTESVVAVGDGANDIPMVQAAGLGVAFNAKPALREVAHVELDLPSLAPVRLFAELES